MVREYGPTFSDRAGLHEWIIPSGTSHQPMGMDEFMGGLPIDMLYGESEDTETTEGSWWDGDYKYRQKLCIYPLSGIAVPSGTVVNLYVAASGMYESGKCLANGNDIRVVKFLGSWNEVSRDYTPDDLIQFETDHEITNKDNLYYLYYGNSGAGAPPTASIDAWDYQDDFGDASLGVEWTTSGTGAFTETGGYLQIQHTTLTWDTHPSVYMSPPGDEFVIQTKITYETSQNHHAGLFISDDENLCAICFGLRDSAGTLYRYGGYMFNGSVTMDSVSSGAVNHYYKMVIYRNTCICYYSTDGTNWTLFGSYVINFEIRRVGLFERATSTTNNNYMRFDYFYMTNRMTAAMIGEEVWLRGNRLRGNKGFIDGALTPFNEF
jgi:hypothetical protein